MKSKIQVLVGMIASGKSTYAKNIAKAGAIIVNDDSIVNAVHADDYTLYDKKLKVLYKSTENHIISIAASLDRLIVVDRGLNGSINGRQRWLSLARALDMKCEAVVFKNEGPETHAQRRSAGDSRGHSFDYWLKVAKAHNSDYSEPTVAEGFDSVHHIDFEDIQKGKVIL